MINEDGWVGHEPSPIFIKNIQKDALILDVGCGPGFWVRYFLRKGYTNISACDLTTRAIELTEHSLNLFGFEGKADLKVGNAESLPYENSTFDHINCQVVIHHTPETKKCIHEFHRVLKPKGTLCFSVYYRNIILRHPVALKIFCRLFTALIKLEGRGREELLKSGNTSEIVRMYDGRDNPIGKSYTLKGIKNLLKDKFRIEERRFNYFPARALPISIPKLFHQFLHDHFGLMIVLSCKKL